MKHEVLLHCDFHDYHFVEFWYDEDFGLRVTFIERPKLFVDRLKSAWKALRGQDVLDGELIIDKKDYKPLAAVLRRGVQNR